MFLTIVLNFVLFGSTFKTPINTEEALAQGTIFHKEGKILITEKFINAEFLVPFRRYNFTIRQQVETLLLELLKKWITQSEFCNMTYSTTYRNQTDVFNVDWLYSKILNETIEAEIEVFKLRNETESKPESKRTPETDRKEPPPCYSSRSRWNWTLRSRNSNEQRRMRWNHRNFRLMPTNVSKRWKYRSISKQFQ